MGRYIIRRVLQAIPLLLLVSIAMFGLIHLLPGGPVGVFLNPHLSAAGRANIEARFGLNDSVPVQYFKWLINALQGNFGFSFQTNQPVTDVLGEHFPPTLELFTASLAVALVIAIILGTISALRQNTSTDYIVTSLSYFGLSMPVFFFALLAQEIFGVALHWLPTSGIATAGVTFDAFNGAWDNLNHLLLPMLVLATGFVAGWSRYLRSSMIEVKKQDYIRTAQAKGVSTTTVLMRHALRNALIPLVTAVAIDFGSIAGGAAITETVFAWPGVGRLFLDSLDARDYPVLLSMLVIAAAAVIAANLIADVLYAVIDPRIRYS
ncbi:MAG: ABC transporter permease [Ktedonobacteraceae bacterium]|nr:ABC transporter permease [Ktedonobacteraceae bacterium]